MVALDLEASLFLGSLLRCRRVKWFGWGGLPHRKERTTETGSGCGREKREGIAGCGTGIRP